MKTYTGTLTAIAILFSAMTSYAGTSDCSTAVSALAGLSQEAGAAQAKLTFTNNESQKAILRDLISSYINAISEAQAVAAPLVNNPNAPEVIMNIAYDLGEIETRASLTTNSYTKEALEQSTAEYREELNKVQENACK